jgi:hypothetical protein
MGETGVTGANGATGATGETGPLTIAFQSVYTLPAQSIPNDFSDQLVAGSPRTFTILNIGTVGTRNVVATGVIGWQVVTGSSPTELQGSITLYRDGSAITSVPPYAIRQALVNSAGSGATYTFTTTFLFVDDGFSTGLHTYSLHVAVLGIAVTSVTIISFDYTIEQKLKQS